MRASHRFFDHTGDFGVDLRAPTREALFAEVARAWIALLTDAPDTVEAREERTLEVEGLDDAERLVALGNELLYLFETHAWLAARIDVRLEGDVVHATAHGERYDPDRHPIARPAKAVTHHGAEVVRDGDGWRGRLIFDL